jgi:hypothetical protein
VERTLAPSATAAAKIFIDKPSQTVAGAPAHESIAAAAVNRGFMAIHTLRRHKLR